MNFFTFSLLEMKQEYSPNTAVTLLYSSSKPQTSQENYGIRVMGPSRYDFNRICIGETLNSVIYYGTLTKIAEDDSEQEERQADRRSQPVARQSQTTHGQRHKGIERPNGMKNFKQKHSQTYNNFTSGN
ncbi:hypothetical protein HHI36_006066 [Cryptolaemus montrouzieri]|uniref:Uncharacterized protein n=1 Tax=Cryptolaemus montrouzieri TaxID=559131 RepID=A0ABD2NWG8_9CUCU